MFTENIRTLCGPNYWSVKHHSLIVVTLSLKDPDKAEIYRVQEFFTSFPDFLCHSKNVETLHDKVEEFGEILIKIVESVLKAFHAKSKIPLDFIDTNKVSENKYNIIFSFTEKKSGVFAAESSIRLLKAYLEGEIII
jgi:cyanophycin synthetase